MRIVVFNAMKVIEKLNSATTARLAYCESGSGEEEKVDRYFKEIKLLLSTENQLITVIENALENNETSELLAALDAIEDDEELTALLS
jgi:hypothetical protein